MMTALLAAVIVATGLVVLCGVWVAAALIAAVWRVDRPASSPSDKVPDNSTE